MTRAGRFAAAVLKRTFPVLGAVLLAVFPLLSLFAQNPPEVALSVIRWPLALCLAITLLLYGVLLLFKMEGAKAGLLAALAVVGFFYYGSVADQLSAGPWFLAVWLACFVVAGAALVRSRGTLDKLVVIVVAGVVVVARPVIDIVSYRADHPRVSIAAFCGLMMFFASRPVSGYSAFCCPCSARGSDTPS